MIQIDSASEKIIRLIEVLKTSCGLPIDVVGVEEVPKAFSSACEVSVELASGDANFFANENVELREAIHCLAAAVVDIPVEGLHLTWLDSNQVSVDRGAHC